MTEPQNASEPKRVPRLWNLNFALLWQGQFVSAIGDVAYSLALGFWILAVTGSTGLMGALMAASIIPRVVVAPFAGVIVDRSNRKWLLVVMDLVRGAVVVLVAVAIYAGTAQVWMVFAAGAIIGLCAAFFNPSINSVIPDIVHQDRIVKANSFFSMMRAGSGILGSSLGGALFALLGAPLMFLINGISYLFSAVTETFLRIPSNHSEHAGKSFLSDLKEGLTFVWHNKGIRFLLLTSGVMNFFAAIGKVLFLPLFHRAEWLGPTRYGITLAVFTIGMVAGMITTASVEIAPRRRMRVFGIGTVAFVVPLAAMPFFGTYWPMLVCMGIGGYFNSIVNVLTQSVLQLGVPPELRGKVFGLLDTFTTGLMPLGVAIGGVAGEFLPLSWVIGGAFALIGVYVFPQLGSKGIRAFFATPSQESEQSVTST